jgi:uncharacterized protein YneF (UPF0154 family)
MGDLLQLVIGITLIIGFMLLIERELRKEAREQKRIVEERIETVVKNWGKDEY